MNGWILLQQVGVGYALRRRMGKAKKHGVEDCLDRRDGWMCMYVFSSFHCFISCHLSLCNNNNNNNNTTVIATDE